MIFLSTASATPRLQTRLWPPAGSQCQGASETNLVGPVLAFAFLGTVAVLVGALQPEGKATAAAYHGNSAAIPLQSRSDSSSPADRLTCI